MVEQHSMRNYSVCGRVGVRPEENVPAAEDYVRRSDVRVDETFLIETLGRELLELDRDQAEELFYTTDHEEVLNILRVWSE